MMVQQQLLLSFCLLSSLTISAAFSPLAAPFFVQTQTSSAVVKTCVNRNSDGVSLEMAAKRKKKKPSMKERLQRRREKAKGGPNPYADLPSPNLELFSSDEEKEEPIKVANPEAAAEKAKQLLKAQRDSVNMLTLVKEQIMERLSESEFRGSLEENGFAVIDDFFGSNSSDDTDEKKASPASILTQLEEEGSRMLEEGGMEVDVANLGKGQYIAPIAGGEKQYTACPRIVEIVVSATKHVPEVFGDDSHEYTTLKLDPSACMATLRSFDRKALKASLALLMGNENADDILEQDTPFSVMADKVDDQRKLSLNYYIVSDKWDEQCGGGLEFESGVKVHAKKDRLVAFYSDSTKFKSIVWKGSDDAPETRIGSAIELHLVRPRV
eukprot:jgi/Psemu1/312725/fgenesh1_kg.1006_\